MKYSILAGASVLGMIVMATRSASSVTVVRERRVEVPVRVEIPVPVPVEVPRIVETLRTERPASESIPRPAGASVAGTVLARERMLFLFEREIDLKHEQRRFMEEALSQRDKHVEALQEEIRNTGIFRVREYERQMTEIQGASFQRMAQVLTPEQQRRFAGLVTEGRLGDAIAFEVGPKMIVVQD